MEKVAVKQNLLKNCFSRCLRLLGEDGNGADGYGEIFDSNMLESKLDAMKSMFG